MSPIVRVQGLTKEFPVGQDRVLRAVDGVEFEIGKGETLGLVGESGSGKSTTGRILIGLIPPSAGEIELFGQRIGGRRMPADVRRRMQFVFQDPSGALNPRMRAGDSIAEPMVIAGENRANRTARVAELLSLVGLPRDAAERYGIARALALQPDFIICDEPVSALDVSMQAQVINLLLDLQERLALSYLFIAHDLAVVRSISTNVAVMYAGRLVEIAPRRQLYEAPRHPYTKALLAAVPRPDPDRQRGKALGGEVPSVIDPPAGCAFAARCPIAEPRCRQERPALRQLATGHRAACHLA
jgi:oligopeptide/dipeptide ABC transporter ATP-binding protein